MTTPLVPAPTQKETNGFFGAVVESGWHERSIDVHIKALRQKLGPLGRQIETVRKAGYRLTAETGAFQNY